MMIKIYPQNPSPKEIERVTEILRGGGVIVYPTDGVYAFGCSLANNKAVERLKALRNRRNDQLTIVCENLSRVSEYAVVDNAQFRILKNNLPGAFTFILKASSRIPDKALGKRKNVGVRIPDNNIALAIVAELGIPLATASVKDETLEEEYTTDPELIEERYGHLVDAVIDGGYGSFTPTTLVDLSEGEAEIIREGGGDLS